MTSQTTHMAETSTDTTTESAASAKWGAALDAGFQIVPNVLIRAQSKLGLDPLDLAILLNITLHWWDTRDLPYPRTSMIANRVGVSVRTVERRLERMQNDHLLVRHPPERTKDGLAVRRFDLSGLVQRLQKFAQKNLDMRRRGYYFDAADSEEDE